MNKKLGLGILSLFSLCGLAQTPADSVQVQQLNEAVVNSARIVKRQVAIFSFLLPYNDSTQSMGLTCSARYVYPV